MTCLKNIKHLLGVSILGASLFATSAFAGFSISGTQLLDGNGQQFIMRGINHAHTWFTGNTGAIADIAKTGANTVRVVLSNGQTWNKNSASDVRNIINLCKQNKLICVLEVHDVTGVGDTGGNSTNRGTISGAADYFVELSSVLKGQEDYVIINIANEPAGNGVAASKYVGDHQAAIRKIRDAGLTHTLMVDAANWGQDWEEIMLKNAYAIAGADTLQNTMFSVHMYQVFQNYNKVYSYIARFMNDQGFPLIVGEFGDFHQGEAVDADSIMQVAEDLGVGYLGWSWSGNDANCCANLDIAIGFNAGNLSSWGKRLINSTNGIKNTSVLATVYTGSPVNSSSSSRSSSSVASSRSSAASSAGNTTTGGSISLFHLLAVLGLLLVRLRKNI